MGAVIYIYFFFEVFNIYHRKVYKVMHKMEQKFCVNVRLRLVDPI